MPDHEEKEALVQAYVEGALTPEEAVRLRELMKADPALARIIAENLRMDGAIREAVSDRVLEAEVVRRRPRITRRVERRSMGPVLGVLAAAGFLLAIGLALQASRKPTPRPPVRETSVAKEEPAPPPPAPQPIVQPPKPPIVKPVVVPEKPPEPRPEPPKPEPPKPEVPKPEPPKPELPTPKPTEVRPAVARVEGDATIDDRKIAGPVDLLVGQRLESTGRASVAFKDKTTVELAPQTLVREVRVDGGKTVLLDRGEVRAVVTKQDKPMVFLTPHATATVRGTTLRIVVDAKSTRLDVIEGKVELENAAGRTLVESGHSAVADAAALGPARPKARVLLEREGATVSINFGPEDVTPPAGWLKDWGQNHDADRGYGWKTPAMAGIWDQNKVKTDPLHASFVYGGNVTETVEWAIAVPNGRYAVLVSVGTYKVDQGPHYVRIQGLPLVNKEMTRVGEFKKREGLFKVDQGELSMQIGGHGTARAPSDKSDDTVINYIVIKRLKD